jgi:hypothetical protein
VLPSSSSADRFYIAAAKESGIVIVSADEKMVKAAKRVLLGDAAVHIKDLESQLKGSVVL